MLREIAIKNFAIIDDLRINFEKGLNIISGETGAGKSIIITALGTLLGGRADASMIRTDADTAELEALFDMDTAGPVAQILKDQGHEAGEELILRRILSKNNRHRVYINGRLATMQLLSRLTDNLAGISGQHEHQRLLKESEHLRILDQFGGILSLRSALSECYREIKPLIQDLESQREQKSRQTERLDLLGFQKQEIEAADLSPGEEKSIKQALKRLKNAESLYQTVGGAIEELYNREGAVAERLKSVHKDIEKAAAIDSDLSQADGDLSDAAIRIEETVEHLRRYADGIEFDPQKLEEYESRLDTINRLKRKYGGSIEEILEYRDEIKSQLAEIENIDDKISRTEAALAETSKRLCSLASELYEKRRAAAEDLAEKMEAELRSLKMADTRFSASFRENRPGPDTPKWLCMDGKAVTEQGTEQVVFMISPNPGESPKPLSKIASGGELSRVILALKAILADTEPVETVVFDEVDAGIGGEVAEVVGKKLANLAGCNQIICITHLAQIARFGDHHFRITKAVCHGRTATRIDRLDESGRIEETARMIGGEEITETTLAHAKEMLRSPGPEKPGQN
ncbi:MAG: DNA repair protein RecN [Desulfobacteraceae bacterium]|nr:DNA repair protein RecN [Desulfobacteraceae bacterium]MCF8094967.1 DNA repair protein RecN [Desulfobacteraceae bacterium]